VLIGAIRVSLDWVSSGYYLAILAWKTGFTPR